MKGQYLITRLLNDANAVVMLGPVVLKRLGGLDARRKYHSEKRARAILTRVGMSVVPILGGIAAGKLIVLPRVRTPTLDRNINASNLGAFEEHVVAAAGQSFPASEPGGYYWLDAPRRRRSYSSFADFLIGESVLPEKELMAGSPQVHEQALLDLLHAADPFPDRILVLTDIAPKNIFFRDGNFTHVDLEATLVGPAEFLLVKAAVNLATDYGAWDAARQVRRRLLARCASDATARASLAFSIMRRMRFERSVKHHDPRPIAALSALLETRPLDFVVSQLEGNWSKVPEL